MASVENITMLLADVDQGRDGALDELMKVVYADLERMAHGHLNRQFGGRVRSITLEPAALVNESFMRLIRQRKAYDNRGQFFAIATRLMVRVLIDYCRSRNAQKRGGGDSHVTLVIDEQHLADGGTRSVDVVEIEELAKALDRLEAFDRRKADVVRMRVIWSLDADTISEALEISPSTVERDWRFAKAWLADDMESSGADSPG